MNTHGIGLGLVIAKHIVESFGGTISLSSEAEKGSIFTFSFLLEQEESSPEIEELQDYRMNSYKLIFDWAPSSDVVVPYVG